MYFSFVWSFRDGCKSNCVQVQLKPLTDQLSILKDLPAPEFGSLQAWEVQANGDFSAGDPFKYLLGLGFGGTTMPFVGETKVTLLILLKFPHVTSVNSVY